MPQGAKESGNALCLSFTVFRGGFPTCDEVWFWRSWCCCCRRPLAPDFWLFRRPVETPYASSYAPTYYAPPSYFPSTVCWVPAEPAVVIPESVVLPLAVPSPAPPSALPELPPLPSRPAPPIMPPADPATTTARRVGEPYFDLYAGQRKGTPSAGVSVAFWNLTAGTVTLRVQGRDWDLPPRRKVTLDLPRSFSWNVVGRQAEQTRLAGNQTEAEILLRR